MEIKKAKREKIKVPIMISGASGSGKTVGSLLIAKGIIEKMFPDLSEAEQWEKIGVIDTEHKRSLLYADSKIGNDEIGEFMHIDLEPPFTVQRYIQAFNLFKQSGVEVVIVDSMTHAWSGEGGLLEQVEALKPKTPKMPMQAWNKIKPLEKEFLKLFTEGSMYVIGTARSKQAYDMEKGDNGKTRVVKMGLKPDQRENLEYEFAITFQMDQNHIAESTKDNSNMFTEPVQITKEVGHMIYEWSSEGIDLEKVRQELINDITKLISKSEQHAQCFNELHAQIKKAPLESLKTSWLERMKERLEQVKTEPKEQKKEVKADDRGN